MKKLLIGLMILSSLVLAEYKVTAGDKEARAFCLYYAHNIDYPEGYREDPIFLSNISYLEGMAEMMWFIIKKDKNYSYSMGTKTLHSLKGEACKLSLETFSHGSNSKDFYSVFRDKIYYVSKKTIK